MHTTRPRSGTAPARRRLVAAASALALGVGMSVAGVATAGAAHAGTAVTSGSLSWGFKASFRAYVGGQLGALPPLGALPVGERITTIAPASFDPAATPADEKRPYVFPASSGSVASADDAEVSAEGGVVYRFPSHYFEIRIANPTVVVDGGTATILADTYYNATEAFGDAPAGEFTGTQVPIATADSATVTVAADGASATLSGSGVTLTAEGAAKIPLYTAGTELDAFSAVVSLEDTAPPAVPTVTVSSSVVNPAGEQITVSGTGFDPAAAIGTRPPLSGQPAGTYVVFGTFLDTWKPSAGAPSSARKVSVQKWAVPAAGFATIGGEAAGAVLLSPEGSFTTTITVKRGFAGALANGNYGIYTYPASGAVAPSFETYTPISFTPAAGSASSNAAEPGESISVEATGFDAGEQVSVVLQPGDRTLGTLTASAAGAVSGEVTVPEDAETGTGTLRLVGAASGVDLSVGAFTVVDPQLSAYQTITTEVVPTGALTISVADTSVTLPSPQLSADGTSLSTSGALNEVTVTDLRSADPGWSVSGAVTDFTGAGGVIPGSGLGWSPAVVGASAGQVVTAGPSITTGLTTGAVLASTAAGQGRGTATLGAGLVLDVPTTAVPGTYTATVTLTAV